MDKLKAIALAGAVLAVALGAQGADADHKNCTSDKNIDAELRIEACGTLIDSLAPDSPGRAAALALRGQAQSDAGNADQAMTDYTAAIDLYDRAGVRNVPDVYESRAYLYQAQNRQGGAIADFDRAIGADPNRIESYYGRGRSFAMNGFPARAREDFDKVIALKPGFAEAYVARGATALFVGDIPLAMEDFERAIKLNPKLAPAYHNRGVAYDQEGRFALAIADFDRVMALDPTDREVIPSREKAEADEAAWNERKLAAPIIPSPQPAGPVLPSRAVGFTHDCTAAYPEISRMLAETGDVLVRYDVAANGDIGNIVVDKSSGSPRLDRAAVNCVSALWRNVPAIKDGKSIASPNHQAIVRFSLHGGHGDAVDFFGRALGHAAIGDYDGAIAAYDQAVEFDSHQPLLYLGRGWVEYVQGKLDRAQDDFERALKLDPRVPAQEALDLAKAERDMPRPRPRNSI